MGKRGKKRSHKTGLPPGTLLHVGEPVSHETKILLTLFDEKGVAESEVGDLKDYRPPGDGRIAWINVAGIHEPDIMKKVGETFKINALDLEDVMDADHRPKMDDRGQYIFVILKSFLPWTGVGDDVGARQISIIIGRDYVISFQESREDVFAAVRERLRSGAAWFAKMGACHLAYSLIDFVVDNYFTICEQFDEEINEIEELAITKYDRETLERIQKLRREIIHVRRMVWPLREVISGLQKSENPIMDKSTDPYLMDVYEHVIQVMDTTETFREILSNIFDIYLTGVSNRMNEIMKVLTIISTIMLPLTLIVGLYGMNFEHMPELKWQYGYPVVLTLMVTLALVMLSFFKKKKWF